MRRLTFIALAAVLAIWSGTARADSPLLEYIEAWSGPGPFVVKFTGADIRVVCLPSEAANDESLRRQLLDCQRDDPSRVRGLFMFNFAFADNGGKQLFTDDPNDARKVEQHSFEIAYMQRLNSVVDVGGAIQWVHLITDAPAIPSSVYVAASVWRTAPTIRLTITPLGFMRFPGRERGLSRAIHLQYESAYFGGTWQASDFGNFVSRYHASKEFQSRVAVAIDVGALLFGIHPD
ncbi:MAG TPA: hypothetical protein VLV86_13725 [Vicinamibacterales bacterium]|nr:hypothetical protein [Vicinamibacterales bacterium]